MGAHPCSKQNTVDFHTPVLEVENALQEYGTISRQRCLCGSNFMIEDERIEAVGAEHHHILLVRCQNTECQRVGEFAFRITPQFAGAGLGHTIAQNHRPADPTHLFPQLNVMQQAALGLIAAWLAARATGMTKPVLDAIASDTMRHLGLEMSPGILAPLARLGGEFDSILAVLEHADPLTPSNNKPLSGRVHIVSARESPDKADGQTG